MRSVPGVALLLFVSMTSFQAVFAQEWSRFRGPNGSGVADLDGLPVKWTDKDYTWKVDLEGKGHASPVLWGKRLFLVSGNEDDGSRIVECRHADDGRKLWSKRFEATSHRKHALNSFASSTPAVDETRLYVTWGTPDETIVQAIDHEGNALWKVDLGGYKSGHGFGGSPIIHAGKVILGHEHGGDSSLVALDAKTGKTLWRKARETKATYSTPCIHQPSGRPAEVVFTNWKHGITAVDPQTGKTNWEISVFDKEHTETSLGSPIVVGDRVIGTCGYLGYATHAVAVKPDIKKPGQGIEVFRVDRGAPLTTTPVAAHGLLFLWADSGIVTCVDAKTGERVWQKRVGGTYYASPIVVGKAVYCLSTDGEAVVLAASREYELLARNKLGEGSHATPAVANGAMYLRTFTKLMALPAK